MTTASGRIPSTLLLLLSISLAHAETINVGHDVSGGLGAFREGCIWYVEWMNAVDNPTFTYKEVECPKELVELYYSSMHPKP